ncbi:MAG: hypothetical protein HY712_02560 [candidate division NC10 bacterium]|nr:hypothetical protein [candidate division NC10 bacterium]
MEDQPDVPLETAAPPHPAINAMLICDQAMIEEATAKSTLVGVFETISAFQFPARHGPLCVYAKLTDAEGQYRIRLELVRLEDLSVIGQGQFTATFANRMGSAEMVFQLYGLAFPDPGRYEFRLYANNRWMGSKALNVVRAPEPKPQAEQIRVFGSTITVRWLSFMLPAAKPSGEFQ